jgi:hypothetical protein
LVELNYLHELAKYQMEPNKTNERLAEIANQFGGNPRYADNSSDTGMHIAAKIGSV